MDILDPVFAKKATYMAEVSVWDKGCTHSRLDLAESKEMQKKTCINVHSV